MDWETDNRMEMHEINSISDHKKRWGGLLENPYISKIQRNMLDAGRVGWLCRALRSYSFKSILDVGCGLGEYAVLMKNEQGMYCGIDNSFPRVAFAARRYRRHRFVVGDARQLPFPDGHFDAVLLMDTSHHLSDEEFRSVLRRLKDVSKRYVIVGDPVVTEGQNRLSRFFYKLDRGGCFRDIKEMQKIFAAAGGLKLVDLLFCRTFPGLYARAACVLEKTRD